MEFEEKNDQDQKDDSEETESGNMKQWLQDNLRIIISVLIVVIIAGGIYSYSKRAEAPQANDQASSENILEKIAGTDENQSDQQSATVEEKNGSESEKQPATQQEQTKPASTQAPANTSSAATSQETDKSFVETAVRGDGTTKLARRALANYLEKNPDSSLTAEHKIYIEDYLRKKVAKKGGVTVGTSVEFEKSLIADAIAQSKNLNQKQLSNLHKYAVRVPSLSWWIFKKIKRKILLFFF